MKKLRKDISAGRIDPVYFFDGPESYLKEEMTDLIRKHVFPTDDEAAINTTVLYGQDTTLGEIVSTALEIPMFTIRKVVVVKQFEKTRKPGSAEKQKLHLERFLHYLSKPAASTTLILDADQIDRKNAKKSPFSELEPYRHNFPPIRNPDQFASERALQQGWEFEPEALKTFSTYIQASAREIARETEKLILYASSRSGEKSITSTDVYACVGISKQYNVFELEKVLAAKNLRQCSGISLMIMEREGQKDGLMNIVRYLTTFFTRIWKLHSPDTRGLPQAETAKLLGMYGKQEYFAKNYRGYASRFSLRETEDALLALKQADAALKGLEAYPDEKYLLLRLMHRLLQPDFSS